MRGRKKDKRVGFLLESTTRIVKLCFNKAFNQLDVDITPEQWVVLDTLMERGPLSQVDISEIIFKDAPTVSRLIDQLERKGFLNRLPSETDRRATIIRITKEGKNLVDHCINEVRQLRELTWKDLSEEDYLHFTRIINQVFNNMQSY
ncbi:MAG: MarR family transcriptional regulator [Saprospiraceae bacterium]|nr:MarR family transcriptional regulator [Saprospiraceae bacterium]